MAARLSPSVRRKIAAEVRGSLETVDRQIYADEARRLGMEWIRPSAGSALMADYLLVKAIDRWVAGEFTDEDLFRCRCIAFYMVFGIGGEEWDRMGVAFGMTMGRPNQPKGLSLAGLPDEDDLEDDEDL